MNIIAHRGASHIAPENTLAAFETAWKENADGIELDIRLTACLKLVVIHDATTKRTTGSTISIHRSQFQELQQLDAGSWKHPQWVGEPIPLLSTVLDRLPENKHVLIEIKSGPETLPSLDQLIKQYEQIHDQMIFISFHYDVISKLKKCHTNITALWIVEFGYNVPKFTISALEKVVQQTLDAGLDGISSKAVLKHCKALAPYVHQYNWLWNVWTVDNPSLAEKLKSLGIHMLSTNTPEHIRTALSKKK